MRFFLSFILLVLSNSAAAQPCAEFAAFGQPVTQTKFICRQAYAVHYHEACKAPLLVQEWLKAENISGSEPRSTFKPDPSLASATRSTSKDYARSGFDKGHLAPAADFSQNAEEMDESFYLSNAVPQNPKLNRGQWKSLEIRARALAGKYNSLFVYTGVIFGNERIGSGVCVPTHMYKIFIDTQNFQSIAYLMPNTADVKTFSTYEVTVEDLEKLTKINYTPRLVDPFASKFKQQKSLALRGK